MQHDAKHKWSEISRKKKKFSAAKWINELRLKIQENRIIPFYIPWHLKAQFQAL